jgi:cytochrome c biogenesis protein CcdA
VSRQEQGRVAARRARFRDAVARLSERAQSTELMRMLLFPGALAVVLGFVFMFFGWYGASRTPRQIEQIPYLISGGLIGLGLVFVGALLLACALWMSMLQRFTEESEKRLRETQLATPPTTRATPARRTRSRRP